MTFGPPCFLPIVPVIFSPLPVSLISSLGWRPNKVIVTGLELFPQNQQRRQSTNFKRKPQSGNTSPSAKQSRQKTHRSCCTAHGPQHTTPPQFRVGAVQKHDGRYRLDKPSPKIKRDVTSYPAMSLSGFPKKKECPLHVILRHVSVFTASGSRNMAHCGAPHSTSVHVGRCRFGFPLGVAEKAPEWPNVPAAVSRQLRWGK